MSKLSMLRETELIRSPAANARPENPTISRRTRNRRFGRRPAPSSSNAASTASVDNVCTTSAQ